MEENKINIDNLLSKEIKYPILCPPDVVRLPDDWDHALHVVMAVRGGIFFLDRDVFELIQGIRMYLAPGGYVYAGPTKSSKRLGGTGKKISVHRLAMGDPENLFVDHINRDRKDNRRCNLRIAHPSQNNSNRERSAPLRGVRFRKGKWNASITFQYRAHYLGRFDDKDEAARAYDKKAVELFGGFALTNFPITDYELPAVCASDLLSAVEVNRFHKGKAKCLHKNCRYYAMPGKSLCRTHQTKEDRIQARLALGEKVIRQKRVDEVSRFCEHADCANKGIRSFSRNLCSIHYTEQRKNEGYIKPPKTAKYYCFCGGKAQFVKERLCRIHWREKHKVPKKQLGRPGKAPAPCSVCGLVEILCKGLCPFHYMENYREKNKSR